MPDPITATVEPAPPDNRPEPPEKFPTLYAVRRWYWADAIGSLVPAGWRPLMMSSGLSLTDAERDAQSAHKRGDRNVRIVTIPGDQP